VKAPGRMWPLLAGGVQRLRRAPRPTRWLIAALGCLRRRVVALVDRRPRLAPRPAVSGRIVAGSGQVQPDLVGCLEDGHSSLEVMGSPSSLPSHQPATGCRWGWQRPWLCSGGHGSDVLPHVGCHHG
jgi:hypothetical protein